MAEKITQELGFDAAQAIQTLATLDASLKSVKGSFSSLTKSMGSFNTKADKSTGILKKLKTAAGGAATQMNRLQKSADKSTANAAPALAATANNMDKVAAAAARVAAASDAAGKKGAKAGKSMLISWQTLGRVLLTQAIVRTLNQISQGLKTATKDAIDFQRAVAEIGTIGGQLGGLDAIGDMVTRVSDQFNVGLADTAEAAYQTVSNQIASTEEDVESFLGSAAKFTKITKTDMTTAVNLLSGTLNAFGKDVSETEDVAAKFFKTIELGRTRAEELAQGMGTIAPVADKLGISMEELNAAVATLTIGGIKTDKAITQIRGAMQGFLKPTTEMKEVMQELGFATGEQVLEAYNLQEAIRAVVGATDGNAAAVAKLFPRIRGLTGVLGLADDQAEHFSRTLREQETALSDSYDKAYTLVIETDAEKVTKFFNQVKNFFVTKFGQRVLSGAAFLIEFAFKEEGNGTQAILDAQEEITEEHKAMSDAWLADDLARLDSTQKAAAQAAAVQRKGFMEAAAAAEQANQIISASSAWAIESLMGPVHAAVEGVKKAAAEIQNVIDAASQEQVDSLTAVQDILFQRAVSTTDDPIEKISLLRRKSAEESIRAQELAANALTQADVQAAKSAQAASRAYNSQAFSIAQSSKEKKLASALSQDLTLQEDRYIKASKSGQAVQWDSAKSLAESAREVVAYEAELESLAEKLQELQKGAAATGLTPGDQDAALQAADKAAVELAKKYEEGIERFAKSVDPVVRKLFAKIEERDTEVEIQTILMIPGNIWDIQQQVQEAFGKIEIDPDVKAFASLRKLPLEKPTDINEARKATFEAQRENSQELEKYRVSQELITLNKRTALNIANEELKLRKEMTKAERVAIDSSPFQRDITDIVDKQLVALRAMASGEKDVTLKALRDIKNNLQRVEEVNALQRNILSKEGLKQVDDFKAVLDNLEKVANAQAAKAPEENLGREIMAERRRQTQEVAMAEAQVAAEVALTKANTDAAVVSQDQLNTKIKEGAAAAEIQQSDQAATQLKTTQEGVTVAVGETINGVRVIASGYQEAQVAAQGLLATTRQISAAASTAQGPLTVQNPFVEQAHGGRVGYFANGGRGTDTIPAMLSAGETVTNARSSRRFFSQLQAMNAGQTPVYRNDGGDTFNTNVGDINVSGAGNPQQTAREVMKAIRREERRGSSR